MIKVVSDEKYFGVYRAVVVDSDDPSQLGRVKIAVPEVTDDAPGRRCCPPALAMMDTFCQRCIRSLSSRSRPATGSGHASLDNFSPNMVAPSGAERLFSEVGAAVQWHVRHGYRRRALVR